MSPDRHWNNISSPPVQEDQYVLEPIFVNTRQLTHRYVWLIEYQRG
jgi:hypothetical protein